jgi:hypothetical protein
MSGAMLECAICNARKWREMDPSHEEDLRMAGAARLLCENCTRETYWFYSQHAEGAAAQRRTAEPPLRRLASEEASEGSLAAVSDGAGYSRMPMRVAQADRRTGPDRRGRSRRAQRRVALHVPVRLRVSSTASQFEEVTRTVNVCRNGIYIQTERPYSKGSPIYVAMNYSAGEPAVMSEQKATVVRVDSSGSVPGRGVAIQLF